MCFFICFNQYIQPFLHYIKLFNVVFGYNGLNLIQKGYYHGTNYTNSCC